MTGVLAGIVLPIPLHIEFAVVAPVIASLLLAWVIVMRRKCPHTEKGARNAWWINHVLSFLLGATAGVLIYMGICDLMEHLKTSH